MPWLPVILHKMRWVLLLLVLLMMKLSIVMGAAVRLLVWLILEGTKGVASLLRPA